MDINQALLQSPWFWLVVVWSVVWKGLALYRAGTLRDKWWFIGLLVINTVGVLEIFYLLVWSKRDRGGLPSQSA